VSSSRRLTDLRFGLARSCVFAFISPLRKGGRRVTFFEGFLAISGKLASPLKTWLFRRSSLVLAGRPMDRRRGPGRQGCHVLLVRSACESPETGSVSDSCYSFGSRNTTSPETVFTMIVGSGSSGRRAFMRSFTICRACSIAAASLGNIAPQSHRSSNRDRSR
jgi:hypothetical protein